MTAADRTMLANLAGGRHRPSCAGNREAAIKGERRRTLIGRGLPYLRRLPLQRVYFGSRLFGCWGRGVGNRHSLALARSCVWGVEQSDAAAIRVPPIAQPMLDQRP